MPVCTISRTAIYPCPIRARPIRLALHGRALHRRPIISLRTHSHLGSHAIRDPILVAGRHAVMRAVEAHVADAVVALDARGFLHTSGHVLADFAEDGNLALDHLGVFAPRHVAADIAYKALPGALVPHALVQDAWGVEVLGADLAEERYGFAGELAVDLVEVGAAALERDGLDGGKVVGAGALVIERHVAVALEIGHAVGSAAAVDG